MVKQDSHPFKRTYLLHMYKHVQDYEVSFIKPMARGLCTAMIMMLDNADNNS